MSRDARTRNRWRERDSATTSARWSNTLVKYVNDRERRIDVIAVSV